MPHEGIADDAPLSDYHVEYAGRQPRLLIDLGEEQSAGYRRI
jgi:hypothetical protein